MDVSKDSIRFSSQSKGDSVILTEIVKHDGTHVTFSEFAHLLSKSVSFQDAFTSQLSSAPFRAFFFETPVMCARTAARPFHFAVLRATALELVRADSSAFAEFISNKRGVVSFANRGRDSTLIAPCDEGVLPSPYAHIGEFVRGAPAYQIRELWRIVGETTMGALLSERPTWLSTVSHPSSIQHPSIIYPSAII